MKIEKKDRLSKVFSRSRTGGAAAALLAGLLLALGPPASGQFRIEVQIQKRTPKKEAPTSVAGQLAEEVGKVQQRFAQNRRALPTLPGPGGTPAHRRQQVADLIDQTGRDLDQAIERVPEPSLNGLQAWAADEIRFVRGELEAAPGAQTAAWPWGPRAIAVVASLGGVDGMGGGWGSFPVLLAASTKPATIEVKQSARLLDQVGEVIGRIFFLAEKDDLEVDLWVGSTPVQEVTFRYWAQGSIKGSAPAPAILRTNGKREHVPRGLYSYSAALAKGPVTEYIAYPPRTAGTESERSERLDLVNQSSFFCCRFGEKYCQHVADEAECRTGGR